MKYFTLRDVNSFLLNSGKYLMYIMIDSGFGYADADAHVEDQL